MLIVGGEDHKTGEADDAEERFARLEAWTRRYFPAFSTVSHRWSGQVLEPMDGVGFVGRNPGNRNVYLVTGDSGQGLTTGVVAGMLIRDLVLGRENRWAALYDPARSAALAPLEYVKENVSIVENRPAIHAGRGCLGRRPCSGAGRDRSRWAEKAGGLSR